MAGEEHEQAAGAGLRRAIWTVALLNLGYFAIEFSAALSTHSAALFADSADFFEDAAVNFLIVAALGWSAQGRAQLGSVLAAILLVPALAFAWTLWRKFTAPAPPEPLTLGVVGIGALAVNIHCAFLLARWRRSKGSLTVAAFLSARNDALANIAIIGAGVVTYFWRSIWPDIIVGIGIALMNLDAARAVWKASVQERANAQA
jgi:Co/Zn/Cd efflux system component